MCHLPIFWPRTVTIYVFRLFFRCFSPSPKKTHLRTLVLPRLLLLWDYLISVVNQVYEFLFVRLFLTRCRLFRSILALLFFLRFWLMLGAASPWVWTKFSRLWCCLPRRWFAVNSPCSSWFSKSGFWWSDIYALFHSSMTVPWFADFDLFPLSSMFFHLVTAFITACISGGSPIRYVCQSKFG